MLELVKSLVISGEDTPSSVQKVQVRFRESKNARRNSSTYPSIYYETLFCNIEQLVKVGKLSS